jgi:hypothetical protein
MSEMRQWQYRRVEVSEDGVIIEVPKKAKCLNIHPLSKKTTTLIEWLEPVEGDE